MNSKGELATCSSLVPMKSKGVLATYSAPGPRLSVSGSVTELADARKLGSVIQGPIALTVLQGQSYVGMPKFGPT